MQPVIAYNTSPHERILVIADIHGGHKALIALLAELQPGPRDLLVTLGDYIDRGPDSREVIEVLRNCALKGNSVHLRGNHEGMLLMAMSRAPAVPDMYDASIPDNAASIAHSIHMWLSNGGLDTLESYCRSAGPAARKSFADLKKALDNTYWPGLRTHSTEDALIQHCTDLISIIPGEDYIFLRQTCVDALATARHILVHGGYKAHCSLDEQTLATLHWGRPPTARTFLKKTLVVGHQIVHNRLPVLTDSLLYLDTGSTCVADGRLTCMDIISLQFWQADQNGRLCHHGQLTPQP